MRVKSESRRLAIVDAARQVFSETGFESASMNEIARRVGFSKATVYNYFSSKEEVFLSVMETFARRQLAEAFNALEAEGDLLPLLKNFSETYLQSITEPEILALEKIVAHEAHRSKIGQFFYEHGPKRGLTKLENFLEQHIKKGNLCSAEPRVCAQHFLALIIAEYYDPLFLNAIERPDPDELKASAARAVDVFLRAYRP
ncbi:TetR/AcrR family transcriptional regulator [Gynuella sunshinyii]|uniref:Transcriptional regulator n=1 Tax=Gynuella sunshinyii YC6258 TaxID=1445510 RepID=A0A0C5VHL8_9GAMM|nr:TetR/AcrR family transcriptional regulator [Gynuella sunshinyii]AJQ94162.1 transcriptional regulator [Gynuella sunshinyii YC6258]